MTTPVRRAVTAHPPKRARPAAAAAPKRVAIEKPPATASASARAFNKSGRQFADLERFVGAANTGEVAQYFTRLAKALGKSVSAGELQAIARMAKNPSVKQLAAVKKDLQKLFANDSAGFATAQTARAAAAAANFVPELQVLTGDITVDAQNRAQLKTVDGRTLNLARASRAAGGGGGLQADWLLGFVKDKGPMTVRGTYASDGQTLMVEDFAPGSSGNFVDGRVRVDGANVIVDTTRGEVAITNPEFKAKLLKLPKLGVILPGATVERNGKQTYAEDPAAFYALGRFNDGNPPGQQVGGYTKTGDFAFSIFRAKPVRMAEQPPADRTSHTQRFMALGNFTMAGGEPASFEGTYFSTSLAGGLINDKTPTEGDRVAQAVFTTLAGAAAKDTGEFAGVAADFARKSR